MLGTQEPTQEPQRLKEKAWKHEPPIGRQPERSAGPRHDAPAAIDNHKVFISGFS